MKTIRVVYSFINSYTKESFISINRFYSEQAAHDYLNSRPSWQEWKIVKMEREGA